MGQNLDPSLRRNSAVRGVLAGMLFLVPVLFWRGGLEPFELCKAAVLQLTALALLAIVGVAACADLSIGRFLRACFRRGCSDPITWAMLLGGLSALVSTIYSISPRTSLRGGYESGTGLGTVLALLTVYFVTRAYCCNARDVRVLLLGVAAGLAPATVYALVQAAGLDPLRWEQTSAFAGWTRPIGTLGHPNYLAGFAVMAVPLVVCLARQQSWESGRRLLLGLSALIVLACVVVVASLSRAAWLAGGLALALVLIFQVRQSRGASSNTISWRPGFRLWILTAAVVFIGGCACAAWVPLGPLLERLRHLSEMSSRRSLWLTAWRIFRERPLTGCGLDTFDLAFGRHRPLEYWQVEWGIIPTRAHNDLLHTLATQGVLGGTAFLLLAGALILGIWRAWQLRGPEDRPLILAAAAALLTWYVQNLFGFPVTATACLFTVLAALLSRLAWPDAGVHATNSPPFSRDAESSERSASAPRAPLRGLRVAAKREGGIPPRVEDNAPRSVMAVRLAQAATLIAVAAAAYFLVVQPYLAGCACHEGDDLLAVEPAHALLCHEHAVELDPGRDVLWVKLADSALAVAHQSHEPERQRLFLRARQAIQRACELVPASGQNHANRGRILDSLVRTGLATPQEVLAAFDEAMARDPLNTAYLADAGKAAIGLGLPHQAFAYLHRCWLIEPGMARLHAEMAALKLAKGRFVEAELHLKQAAESDWHQDGEAWDRARSLLCLTYLDTGRPTQALELAEDVLTRRGESPSVHWMRAIALEKLGRRPEALREYERILRLQPDHGPARAALRRLASAR